MKEKSITKVRASISRRSLLKAGVCGAAAASAASALWLLPRKARTATELTLLSWKGYGEPDMVTEFEHDHGVKVVPTYYHDGDEMVKIISTAPKGTYDVILTDAEYVIKLLERDYIEALDPEDYPLDDFFPEFQKLQGHWKDGKLLSVTIGFGFIGVSYNTDLVSEKEAMSYNILWDDKFRGRIGHFDYHLTNLGCLSVHGGNEKPFDLDAEGWARLQELTLSLSPQRPQFFPFDKVFDSLPSGKVALLGGVGDWVTGVLQKQGKPAASVVPEEGGLQWTESYSIGKGTAKHDLARQFIQYFASPKGQVRRVNMAAYPALVPNKRAWELLNKTQPEEAKRSRMQLNARNSMDDIREGRIFHRQLPVRQTLDDWHAFWQRYKAA